MRKTVFYFVFKFFKPTQQSLCNVWCDDNGKYDIREEKKSIWWEHTCSMQMEVEMVKKCFHSCNDFTGIYVSLSTHVCNVKSVLLLWVLCTMTVAMTMSVHLPSPLHYENGVNRKQFQSFYDKKCSFSRFRLFLLYSFPLIVTTIPFAYTHTHHLQIEHLRMFHRIIFHKSRCAG